MRRLARILVPIGIIGVVLGLSKLHAVRHAYSFSGSSRMGWAIVYMVLLWIAAYALGIPDLGRRRTLWLSVMAASGLGALTISVAQLFVGDALLPRFVVFGSAVILAPWYVVCTIVASSGEIRAAVRDRVVFVGGHNDRESLAYELAFGCERPAVVVAMLTVEEAVGDGNGAVPLVAASIEEHATLVVLAREAQDNERIIEQVATLHESGLRIRTLALFYEQWLGKLPIVELERVSLMFDIREVHLERYARLKRILDVGIALAALPALMVSVPLVLVGNTIANRGSLVYRQPRIGRNGVPFSIVKYRTMRSSTEVIPNEWTSEQRSAHHRFRSGLASAAPRRAPAGGQRPARRSLGGGAPARAAAVRARADGQDPLLQPAPPGATRSHGLGAGEVRLRG